MGLIVWALAPRQRVEIPPPTERELLQVRGAQVLEEALQFAVRMPLDSPWLEPAL